MHSLSQHFATEAYNNAWANHRLLKACAQLTDAELAREQHAVDRRLIAYCEALRDDQLDGAVLTPRKAGVIRDRVRRILAHLFEHQIHHRGQAHAMLAGTRVKRRSWTNSSAPARRTCAPATSRSSDSPRRISGDIALSPPH